ncbi:hypothetical protein SRB5_69640 [Streptomyces sp. RB5]|uniref:ABC transporter permease n=2 Tax=Streptomyces smaragdinus TaxID=2585196 RepID=A0A7K0CTG4_9ACTN|nr:hypothetical protein [Streptomyces smaragdinus]
MTPQDQPAGPWQQPWPDGPDKPVPEGRGMRSELVEAVLLALAVAVSGALLGFLWEKLATPVPLVARDGNVLLADSEAEHAIAIDGTFALLALGMGALWAAGVFVWRRRGGVPLVLALALGGVLGAVVAWQLGEWMGPTDDIVAAAKAAGEGHTFGAPLRLGAKTALLAWPVGAMFVHLVLTGLFGPRDPQPVPVAAGPWQGWAPPQ